MDEVAKVSALQRHAKKAGAAQADEVRDQLRSGAIDLTDADRYGPSPRVEAVDSFQVGVVTVQDGLQEGEAVILDVQAHGPDEVRSKGYLLVMTPEMTGEAIGAMLGNLTQAIGRDGVRSLIARRFPEITDVLGGE